MAKAILADEHREEALDQDAMILMIPGFLWNILVKQAHSEGSTPGDVFAKALKGYLKEYGSKDVVDYLWSLSK